MAKKIDVDSTQTVVGSRYPAPYDAPCTQRARRRLGDAAALTHFGVNVMRIPAGTWSSQRHWHAAEDEFIFVLEGEVVLVTDAGEETLRTGDCACFKAGVPDGHHLQNRTIHDAVLLEVGSRRPDQDTVTYPDIDLMASMSRVGYFHMNGEPYPNSEPRSPAMGK